MRSIIAFGLLLLIIAYSCSKDAPSAASNPPGFTSHPSQGTITATVNGTNTIFDTLAQAFVDTGLQLIHVAGFRGVPKTDTPWFSDGFQETASDYIYLRIGYDYGIPISPGIHTDTGYQQGKWADLRYGKYLYTTYKPQYQLYMEQIVNSHIRALVTSVADSVISGTFSGDLFVDGDPNRKVSVTNGQFKVRMTR